MNWFDIIITLLLLAAFVKGIQKGVVMQLAGFAAIILGAIFAGKAAKIMLPFLLETVNISLNVAIVISYIIAFILIVFAVKQIGKLLHRLFEALHISIINKILGAVIGIATAMVILSIFLNLAILVDPEEEIITTKIKTESFFYPRVQLLVPIIVPYLNKNLWDKNIPEKYRPKIEKEDDQTNLPKELHSYYKVVLKNNKSIHINI